MTRAMDMGLADKSDKRVALPVAEVFEGLDLV
jgi:hypothetical protein